MIVKTAEPQESRPMDKFVNVLPLLIMIESFVASLLLLSQQRWGSALYWFAAGLLNFAVIFCIKRFG